MSLADLFLQPWSSRNSDSKTQGMSWWTCHQDVQHQHLRYRNQILLCVGFNSNSVLRIKENQFSIQGVVCYISSMPAPLSLSAEGFINGMGFISLELQRSLAHTHPRRPAVSGVLVPSLPHQMHCWGWGCGCRVWENCNPLGRACGVGELNFILWFLIKLIALTRVNKMMSLTTYTLLKP